MSPSGPTQKHRRVAIETALGEDALVFRRMTATEHLGRLFQYEIEMVSVDRNINPDAILGKNVTVRLETHKDGTRFFNGFASRFSDAGREERFTRYHMTLRPWFWFLTRTADCRIFQQKKVTDIIKQVFGDLGFSDFDLGEVKGSHPTWVYCVQYRETDFSFVSRLMEQEGIFYWHKHENGKHTLMLTDDSTKLKPIKDYEEVTYWVEGDADRMTDHITDWHWTKEVQPGKYALQDFNFETPKANLMVNDAAVMPHSQAKYEVYDYPGEYKDTGEGTEFVKVRMEELEAQHEVIRGAGTLRGLYVGGVVKLKGYWRGDQNKKDYIVTSVTHEVLSDEYVTEEGETPDRLHTCTFSMIPAARPFRSPRITPKPIIQGPQTAIVVGKSGEEIYPDKYGRVKVQFHWDREGKADENSSCWIRVSQVWAGKQWGYMEIPRVGQEVIVEFLEGDPDRPIITGRVYNAVNMPPYTLPDEKTKSGVKSNSSKGGDGFNEFRFEDKKGEEQVFLHAEKDQDIRVKNDRKEIIMNDRHLIVDNDKFEHVKNDRHEVVDNNHTEYVKVDRNRKVDGNEKVHIVKKQSVQVDADVAEVYGANQHTDVKTDIAIVAGNNICLSAKTNITLKVGGHVISIDSGGIKLETSAAIMIKSGTTLTTDAGVGATHKASANMTVDGGGALTVKGGMVSIN